jgi:hypothetical protein
MLSILLVIAKLLRVSEFVARKSRFGVDGAPLGVDYAGTHGVWVTGISPRVMFAGSPRRVVVVYCRVPSA